MKSQTPKGFTLAVLVALVLAVASSACMSAQVDMFKSAQVRNPSQKIVNGLICAEQPEAARLYLEDHSFDWLGPAKEGYIVDALTLKFRGGCPCAGKTCEERALEKSGARPIAEPSPRS